MSSPYGITIKTAQKLRTYARTSTYIKGLQHTARLLSGILPNVDLNDDNTVLSGSYRVLLQLT